MDEHHSKQEQESHNAKKNFQGLKRDRVIRLRKTSTCIPRLVPELCRVEFLIIFILCEESCPSCFCRNFRKR